MKMWEGCQWSGKKVKYVSWGQFPVSVPRFEKRTWPVSTKILTSCLVNKLICILALDKPLCHFEAIQLGESICDVRRQACDEGK